METSWFYSGLIWTGAISGELVSPMKNRIEMNFLTLIFINKLDVYPLEDPLLYLPDCIFVQGVEDADNLLPLMESCGGDEDLPEVVEGCDQCVPLFFELLKDLL